MVKRPRSFAKLSVFHHHEKLSRRCRSYHLGTFYCVRPTVRQILGRAQLVAPLTVQSKVRTAASICRDRFPFFPLIQRLGKPRTPTGLDAHTAIAKVSSKRNFNRFTADVQKFLDIVHDFSHGQGSKSKHHPFRVKMDNIRYLDNLQWRRFPTHSRAIAPETVLSSVLLATARICGRLTNRQLPACVRREQMETTV
jgi:hypothetical protein